MTAGGKRWSQSFLGHLSPASCPGALPQHYPARARSWGLFFRDFRAYQRPLKPYVAGLPKSKTWQMGHRPTPKGSGRRRWLNIPLDGRGQASGPLLLSEPPGRCLLPWNRTFHAEGQGNGEGFWFHSWNQFLRKESGVSAC